MNITQILKIYSLNNLLNHFSIKTKTKLRQWEAKNSHLQEVHKTHLLERTPKPITQKPIHNGWGYDRQTEN